MSAVPLSFNLENLPFSISFTRLERLLTPI